VIVVIGQVSARVDGSGDVAPAGFAAALARAAADSGAEVEIVSRIGDDPPGDAVLLALARTGIGHVATLRDAGRGTRIVPGEPEAVAGDDGDARDAQEVEGSANEPVLEDADVSLALRYLTDYRVIVVVHATSPGIVREAATAAGWAGAHLVVVVSPDVEPTSEVPDGALVLSADHDAEGTAHLAGVYAAALDGGEEPDRAYAVLTAATTQQ
jgi:sugar/nucleoside kinase (ribokinase family)